MFSTGCLQEWHFDCWLNHLLGRIVLLQLERCHSGAREPPAGASTGGWMWV